MSPVLDKTAHLPEELGMYVDTMRKRYPAIDQVWLLGRPGDAEHGPAGAWELLAFGDPEVLDALGKDVGLHRDDVELLVVTDGDRYMAAWGTRAEGRLSDLGWRLSNPHSAIFDDAGAEDGQAVAMRVR